MLLYLLTQQTNLMPKIVKNNTVSLNIYSSFNLTQPDTGTSGSSTDTGQELQVANTLFCAAAHFNTANQSDA